MGPIGVVPLVERLAFVGLIFLYGLFMGATYCNLTCGPLLVLRLAGQGRGAREGLMLSLLFSMPRIVILTALGALIGALGYRASELSGSIGSWFIAPFLYFALALIMIFTGFGFLRDGGGRNCDRGSIRSRLTGLVLNIGPRKGNGERYSLLGIGILVSLLCFSQGTIASIFVSGLLGSGSDQLTEGVLWGSLGMLFFSTGISTPLIVLGTSASWLGKKLEGEDVRKVGGLILVGIGFLLILLQIISLLSRF
jgi:sulfite exporter TauE/SafE